MVSLMHAATARRRVYNYSNERSNSADKHARPAKTAQCGQLFFLGRLRLARAGTQAAHTTVCNSIGRDTCIHCSLHSLVPITGTNDAKTVASSASHSQLELLVDTQREK